RENAMRNPRRTAATAAALMIGLGLVSFVAVFGASLRSSASVALDATLKADFILSTGTFTPFSAQVARDLEGDPDLAAVSPFRQGQIRVDDKLDFVAGIDPATWGQVATVDMVAGELGSVGGDEILVYRPVAESNGWSVDETIPVEFARTGVRELRIAGIFGDNRLLGNYAVSIETYEANFREQLDFIVFVKANDGVSIGQAREAVGSAVAQFPNIEVNDQAEFKEQQAAFIDQLLALVSALLGLAILIALFGIVNTLSLSIFERTRELGLLRAVGMTRRQVRSMIRWESVIIAVLGAVLGVVIGVLFGWAIQQALVDTGVTRLAIPPVQLAIYVVIAGVAGVLAAITPARRAARLNVLEAIAYE
ncbi:MAG: ABC transporter permease, partial [Actinomycetota bacterium]